MTSIGPAVTREQCPAFLRNSSGRLDLPGGAGGEGDDREPVLERGKTVMRLFAVVQLADNSGLDQVGGSKS